jgi:predicted amidohydrolase YtcJ
MAVLIQRAVLDDVWPPPDSATPDRPRHCDLRIAGGRITEIAPRIPTRPGDEVVDAHGGAVLPGFHDHHVHLRAWAAAASSIHAGPPEVRTVEELERRLRQAPGEPGTWVRAVGYHESVAGDLDRSTLDRVMPDRALRIQHRSGALWVLNSRALAELGVDGAASPPGGELDDHGQLTGRFWRADAWLHTRLAVIGADQPPDLGALSRRAAAAGTTGFTDATPEEDADALAALANAHRDGTILQRLHLMTALDAAGAPAPPPGVTPGPVKVLLDDAWLPAFDELVSVCKVAHARGRVVAVHCVTRAQAALMVAALGEAGAMAGDRMEHGAVLDDDLMVALRTLGVTVVTQPGFVHTRGDQYLVDVEPRDRNDLWRLGSLLDAGLAVAAGTDAPFGPPDPWLAVRAAVSRTTADGRALGLGERIEPRRAAALFCGLAEDPARPRTVARGHIADLMILAGTLDEQLTEAAPAVLATIVDGIVVHRAEP